MNNETVNRGIISWFASNPVAANLLMLLVIALGLSAIGSTRKEAFPSMEPDSITVSISYNSGDARQSEEGLAIKIEDQLEGITGIKSITSSATGSGATVTITKRSDYDLELLLKDIKTRVDAISTFPANAEKPVIEKAEREERALWLQLFGDTDRNTLQILANELKTDLLAQNDISRVSLTGWQDPMMLVEVDEGRLQAYGLTLSDVEDAINQGSSSTTTAVLRNDSTYLQLMASKQAYQKSEFEAITLISNLDGRSLKLGDIATIRDTFDDSTSVLSRFNNHSSIALQIVSTGLDDIADSVNAANQVVEQWHTQGKLPQGVELASWADRSTSINQRLQLLIKNAGTGILLVFILLAVFLNLRVAFWVAAGLPFIFLGTLYFMGDSYLGLTLNEFTTFGFIMALGIVVDDAVVVGESIYSVRSREGDTLANTIKGTMRVAIPTLFGVFTTVVAFFSLSQISGPLGNLYSQFAYIVTLCLILSIIESKLILPAHLAHLKTQRPKSAKEQRSNFISRGWSSIQHGADRLLHGFTETIYRRVINHAIQYRYAVGLLFIAVFVLVISMPFTGAVRMSFFPTITGDTVRASLTMQNDSSFGQTHRNLSFMEDRAYATDRQLQGESYSSTLISNLQVYSGADHSGQVTVELDAEAPYDIQTFTRRWRELVGMPEAARTVNIQNSPMRVDALRVELRANDDELLKRAGEVFKAQLNDISAVNGIDDNLEPGQPQLQLQLTEQGRALGMTTDMLAGQILQAFSGQVVQRYQRNNDEIEVKVRYPDGDRQNPADVLNARVRTSDGTVLPLSSVATTTFGYNRDSITRIDGKRAIYISANVNKDILSSTELVAMLKSNIVPKIVAQFPGVDIHFGGEAEQQAETQTSMQQMFLLALLLIYMLLAIPLRSYIQPVLIMTAIPFGIVGAILGHWLNDIPLGILSLNGIIALSGVVVNDSLLLVARFNDLRKQTDNLHQAISEACRGRLRAVLLTSFTTFAGLLPLLSETSFQAQFLIPAAVSLGYGIMFATVITLVLIPVLLMIQHDILNLLTSRRGRNNSNHPEKDTDVGYLTD